MRKLLITTIAAAGLLLSVTMAGATSTGVTYQHVHGRWDVCVTNGGGSLAGYTKVLQINFGSFASQPRGVESPSGWSGSTMQTGSSWSIIWTANTASALLPTGGPFCGYTFRAHGVPATEPVVLTFMTNTFGCCNSPTYVATKI